MCTGYCQSCLDAACAPAAFRGVPELSGPGFVAPLQAMEDLQRDSEQKGPVRLLLPVPEDVFEQAKAVGFEGPNAAVAQAQAIRQYAVSIRLSPPSGESWWPLLLPLATKTHVRLPCQAGCQFSCVSFACSMFRTMHKTPCSPSSSAWKEGREAGRSHAVVACVQLSSSRLVNPEPFSGCTAMCFGKGTQ